PEAVREISLSFIQAGSQIIQTNTFSATSRKFENFKKINIAGVNLAREAVKLSKNSEVLIAGSVGPTGSMVKPVGELGFEEAVSLFSEQISILESSGCDLLLIETMDDIQEMRSALIAAKETAPHLKIIATMTFAEEGRTSTGTPPEVAALVMDSLGASVIGVNCSFGPEKLAEVVASMRQVTQKPLIAQANAGLPIIVDGATEYPLNPEDYARLTRKMVDAGASYIGGCCGTTPEHIARLLIELKDATPPAPPEKIPLILTSRTDFVEFNNLPVLIGERINFIARPSLAEGETPLIAEARKQIRAGADALDVCLGKYEDRAEEIVAVLSSKVSAPLVIDSQTPSAVEAAVRSYPGVMLLNSVSAEKEKLENLLPIAAFYGMPIIGLCADDEGIALKLEDKKRMAEKIVKRSEEVGIDSEKIIIDPLAISVSSDNLAPATTLESIKILGYKTILGISNISAGMPERALLNQVFSSLAVGAGLSALIANPLDADLVYSVAAASLLSGRDPGSRNYLKVFTPTEIEEFSFESQLSQAILQGEMEKALDAGTSLLKEISPLEMINEHIIPALDKVGEYFNLRIYFLPQLIESARAAEEAIALIPQKDSPNQEDVDKVVIATVEGDVHDIGKNLVALMLKNHSFKIIDLGVDVPVEKIIDIAIKEKVSLIALSSLMTTTVSKMEETALQINERKLGIPLLIGGAAVSRKFAETIGAGYARDAVSAVSAAKNLIRG
ncbi:MAG: dihydropteroate synthase, partial [Elusimicrobia bacterium]|nr:dihydropteroate synthase [Elusimicrobiota bacterium]